MDYNNTPNNGATEPWDLYKMDYCLQKTSNFEIPEEMWNDMPQTEEDLSYMFGDETTPIKACGDLAYTISNSDYMQKELVEYRETSQVKRRRMLQFNSQDSDHSLSSEETTSAYLKLNEKEDSMKDIFPEVQRMSEAAAGNASASGYEDLESTEGWLAECFKDPEMQFGPDDLNFSGANNVGIDVAGLKDTTSSEQKVVQQQVTRTRGNIIFKGINDATSSEQKVVRQQATRTRGNIIFKGRKYFIRPPTKLASYVAYPFALIKPSGALGDVTLKEINWRIRTPPPSKSNQSSEDPSAYPKSAFSGKPVVVKTKIRTEGGKGSITIMRTKG